MTKSNKRWTFWIGIAVLLLIFIYLIRAILLPFVLGIFAAYFLDPAVNRLHKWGLSRSIASLLMIVSFFLLAVALSVLIVPVIASQFAGLIAALPNYISSFQHKYEPELSDWIGGLPLVSMDDIKSAAADFSGVAVKFAGEFLSHIFQSGMAIVHIVLLILISPVVGFYLLNDWNGVKAHFDGLLPRAHIKTIHEQMHIIDRTLAGFVRGQLTICLLMGAYYAIALSLAGLKFGAVIGLMTGVLLIIPYAGSMFGLITGVGVALFQFNDYTQVGIVLAIFIAGQVTEGYVLTPNLVGGKVGLHPVWIIFGMLSGAALFGFVGILLAVPATAVIGVLIRFAIQNYLESDYYRSK